MTCRQDDIEILVDEVIKSVDSSGSYRVKKRLFDIFVSLAGIIILFPLFLITAIAIRIDSPGPCIYKQYRCGRRGRLFKMYKFRSMYSNASQLQHKLKCKNESEGPMFKIRDDPRITRVGRIIRRTSIDELPQLFNVLKGEMSIVGPRPPLHVEVESYSKWHMLRLAVRPGLTGLWQISGRSSLNFDDMVRLDLKYIRERSFLYDLKIVIKTFPVLLGDKNAC